MAETNDREQELAALHRSYKTMENDRQKYSEESQVCCVHEFVHAHGPGRASSLAHRFSYPPSLGVQNIIKRQRQAIEKIRKENERLKEQLKAESQQNAAATEGNTVSVISGMFLRWESIDIVPVSEHRYNGGMCVYGEVLSAQQDSRRFANDTSAK